MLKIDSISDNIILNEASLTVPAGEIIALMGRNGAGKTSLLQSIMGLRKTTSGTIEFKSKPIDNLPTHERSMLGIGYVPQGKRLFADMSVADNINIGLQARRPYHIKDNKNILEDMWILFPLLKDRHKQIAGTLSGGEQQMLAMARALSMRPKLLLLDEVSEGLQPSIIEAIAQILLVLKRREVSVLLVEQNINLVQSTADDLSFLDNGAITDTYNDKSQIADTALLQKHLGI